jgi:hypothetical protein
VSDPITIGIPAESLEDCIPRDAGASYGLLGRLGGVAFRLNRDKSERHRRHEVRLTSSVQR